MESSLLKLYERGRVLGGSPLAARHEESFPCHPSGPAWSPPRQSPKDLAKIRAARLAAEDDQLRVASRGPRRK